MYLYIILYPYSLLYILFFFFNDTATTEIYTLSLHDALPISSAYHRQPQARPCEAGLPPKRSEEHTSELQSHVNLVCRLLLEKKKNNCKFLFNNNKTYRLLLFNLIILYL